MTTTTEQESQPTPLTLKTKIMSYNKNKFQHNLKKAKRQSENERFLLNNIFSGYSKTLIEICNPKINE